MLHSLGVLLIGASVTPPEVTYIGSDHVLLHMPSSGEYWLQRYCRSALLPCAGIAGEPVFAGNLGLRWQRFVPLGGGALLQLDTARGSFLVRQCHGGDRLHLGLRAACPVLLEAPPQRTFSNVSILALGEDVVLLHNTSGPQASNIRAVRFRRDAVLAGDAKAFERLPLSGLIWRGSFSRHELTPLGHGLVLDYETESPAQFRVWRLNPRCTSGSPCNTASDPPLQVQAFPRFTHPRPRTATLHKSSLVHLHLASEISMRRRSRFRPCPARTANRLSPFRAGPANREPIPAPAPPIHWPLHGQCDPNSGGARDGA